MLTALHLGNFKSWREVNAPLAPITGFFGTNSSGKTSLLQALLLMKQSTQNFDPLQVLEFGTEKSSVSLESFSSAIRSNDVKKILKLGISYNDVSFFEDGLNLELKLDSSSVVEFFCEVFDSEEKILKIKKMSYRVANQDLLLEEVGGSYRSTGFNNLYLQSILVGNEENLNIFNFESDVIYPIGFYQFSTIEKMVGRPYHFRMLEISLEKAISKIYYLGPLRDYPKRTYSWSGAAPSNVGKQGENTIAALLAARVGGNKVGDTPLEEYIALQLKQLGLIDSFRLEELREGTNIFRVLVRKTPESPEVSLTDVGFGVSQVLPVLVLCYYVPEGSTVILEQPELHLHPSVQSGLADVFIDAYQKRKVQIIIESHSEHLLRRLQRRIAEEKIETKDVNLYFCSLEHGESKLEALQLDEYGQIHNYPKDFFGDRFEEMAAMTEAGIARREKLALETQ